MPVGTTIGFKVTDTGTSQLAPLGFIYVEPAPSSAPDRGPREWIYVKNDEGATAFAEGTVCMQKASSTTRLAVVATTSLPASRVIGVAQHAIAAGSYGFILRKGLGEVIADTGGITANTGLVPGNAVAGAADDTSGATAIVFGHSTEAVAAAAKATCWLDCRG